MSLSTFWYRVCLITEFLYILTYSITLISLKRINLKMLFNRGSFIRHDFTYPISSVVPLWDSFWDLLILFRKRWLLSSLLLFSSSEESSFYLRLLPLFFSIFNILTDDMCGTHLETFKKIYVNFNIKVLLNLIFIIKLLAQTNIFRLLPYLKDNLTGQSLWTFYCYGTISSCYEIIGKMGTLLNILDWLIESSFS